MDGKVVIGCDLNTKSFDAQIDYVESQMQEIEDKLKQADMGFEVGDTQKLEADYERLGIKLDNLRKKQAKSNQEQANMGKLDLSGVQAGIDNVNKGLNKTIKKVAKWGLAIFGVRSAYMAVRSAMSTISQYEDGMKNNIDYIKYALAYTLKPIVEWILNAVVKLLQYVNYIAKAWTGKNLFKTADAFKNAQKGAKGLNKELQKTTASFDEMNILQDTKSGGGSGADITAPNIDLTGMQGEVPSWIQWIVDNKDLIISALFGIAGGIIAIKLGADLLMGLGIGLIIAGIVKMVKEIIDFIKDPSWDNFAKILEGLTVILIGVAIAMLAVNAANPVAWIVLAIAAVAALAALIIENWDKIKKVLGTVGQWIYDHIIKPVADFFSDLWQGIKDGVGSAVQWVKDKFKTIVDFFGNLISKIVGLFKKIGTKVGDAISGAFKAVINGVLKAIENILNFPIKSINKLINVINKVPGINLGILPTFKLPRLAKGGIINQPGRGIPVGSAIGGERGQEGVIPLTDSQQMQLLGEAIGRYVNINLTNITKLDNRQIAKEQRKINAQNDFAFNR